jgi:hypothetical protein
MFIPDQGSRIPYLDFSHPGYSVKKAPDPLSDRHRIANLVGRVVSYLGSPIKFAKRTVPVVTYSIRNTHTYRYCMCFAGRTRLKHYHCTTANLKSLFRREFLKIFYIRLTLSCRKNVSASYSTDILFKHTSYFQEGLSAKAKMYHTIKVRKGVGLQCVSSNVVDRH